MLKRVVHFSPTCGLILILVGVLMALAGFFLSEDWINFFSAASVVLVFAGLVVYVWALRRSELY